MSNKINILKFEKKGCGPCRMADILLNKVSQKYQLEIQKIDVVENEAALKQYGITSVPTVLVLDENGQEIKRLNNYALITKLDSIVGDLL